MRAVIACSSPGCANRTSLLAVIGCPDTQIKKVELMLGPVRFNTATDRSVQGSINIARRNLEAMLDRVPNVLDLDPLAVSYRLNKRPTTVKGKCLWPAKAVQHIVEELG